MLLLVRNFVPPAHPVDEVLGESFRFEFGLAIELGGFDVANWVCDEEVRFRNVEKDTIGRNLWIFVREIG